MTVKTSREVDGQIGARATAKSISFGGLFMISQQDETPEPPVVCLVKRTDGIAARVPSDPAHLAAFYRDDDSNDWRQLISTEIDPLCMSVFRLEETLGDANARNVAFPGTVRAPDAQGR